jgi:hypothetical protein
MKEKLEELKEEDAIRLNMLKFGKEKGPESTKKDQEEKKSQAEKEE